MPPPKNRGAEAPLSMLALRRLSPGRRRGLSRVLFLGLLLRRLLLRLTLRLLLGRLSPRRSALRLTAALLRPGLFALGLLELLLRLLLSGLLELRLLRRLLGLLRLLLGSARPGPLLLLRGLLRDISGRSLRPGLLAARRTEARRLAPAEPLLPDRVGLLELLRLLLERRSRTAAEPALDRRSTAAGHVDRFVDVLVRHDVVRVLVLAGRVLADLDLHLQRDTVQLLRIADAQDVDRVSDRRQLLEGDLDRLLAAVSQIEASEQLATDELAVDDVEAQLQISAGAVLRGLHFRLVDAHVVPAGGNGLKARIGRDLSRVKVQLETGHV